MAQANFEGQIERASMRCDSSWELPCRNMERAKEDMAVLPDTLPTR